MPGLIAPHGGTLTARLVDDARAAALRTEAQSLPRIDLSAKQSCDLEMLGNGAYSPLDGFMGKADFESVCKTMRLASGLVWSLLLPMRRR